MSLLADTSDAMPWWWTAALLLVNTLLIPAFIWVGKLVERRMTRQEQAETAEHEVSTDQNAAWKEIIAEVKSQAREDHKQQNKTMARVEKQVADQEIEIEKLSSRLDYAEQALKTAISKEAECQERLRKLEAAIKP